MTEIKPAEHALAIDQHEAISRLEAAVLDLPQTDLRTEHALSGQVYARTIHIPAGTVLTGATHKKDHVNIVCGDITVTTDQGPTRITGYRVIATKAGSKRAGFAHADTTWTTLCHTALDDIEAIEDELVEESAQLQTRQAALPGTSYTQLENT
jgi:hypothetical protein